MYHPRIIIYTVCVTLMFIPASTVFGDVVGNSKIFMALDKADAIKRFKAADSNGDCKISKLELDKYAVDHFLDPIQFLLGSSFNGRSGIQVGLHSRYKILILISVQE